MSNEAATAARDAAMDRAAAGMGPEWSAKAMGFVRRYAQHRQFVTAEDVRAFAHSFGLPQAPEPRAWGKVMRDAARAGVLEKVGYVSAKSAHAHCRPSTLWRSMLTNQRGGAA